MIDLKQLHELIDHWEQQAETLRIFDDKHFAQARLAGNAEAFQICANELKSLMDENKPVEIEKG